MMPMGPQRTARPWERNVEEERVLEKPRADAAAADAQYREVKGYALAGCLVLGVAAAVAAVIIFAKSDGKPDAAKGSKDKKDGVYTQKEVFADLEGKK